MFVEGQVTVLERPYITMVAGDTRWRLMMLEHTYQRACDAHAKGKDLTVHIGVDALLVNAEPTQEST